MTSREGTLRHLPSESEVGHVGQRVGMLRYWRRRTAVSEMPRYTPPLCRSAFLGGCEDIRFLRCLIDLGKDAVLDAILAVDVDEVAGTDESVSNTITVYTRN